MNNPRKTFIIIIFLPLFILFLQACASSDLSRSAAANMDQLQSNGSTMFGGGSIADAYQDSSQLSKGMIIGGATGAIAGGLTSSGVDLLPGLLVGSVLGGALGAYIDAHTTLIDQLENRGVRVIVLGDQVMLVLPSARVFDGGTANIRPGYYSTLDLVAKFITGLTKITVKISAYTNPSGDKAAYTSLTQEQAESVERYLWRRGTNSRVMYAAGYGGTNPIVQNCGGEWDEGVNYRVEITLEKLPLRGD